MIKTGFCKNCGKKRTWLFNTDNLLYIKEVCDTFCLHNLNMKQLVEKADFIIDDVLDGFGFFRGHRRQVREVEPQTFRRHHRAPLLDMLAEHLPQRRLQ